MSRDTHRQRRRFAVVVILLFGVLVLVQIPLLAFLRRASGLPWAAALGFYVAVNALLGVRMWYVPKPFAPPPAYDRYVMRAYFGYAVLGTWFLPGGAIAWAFGLPASLEWAWLGASAMLTCAAMGIPWRPVRVHRLDVPIARLGAAFHGLVIAQLTDLHVGPMTGEGESRGWIERVNRMDADYVFVTGDLVVGGADWVPAVERLLASIRARRGVFAVMGNHDYFGHAEEAIRAMYLRLGYVLLDNEHRVIERDGSRLVVAGIDDTWRGRADLVRALDGAPAGVPIVLLAHDPDVFPEAARLGVALQVSGHTHGGQIAVPFLGRRFSLLARFGQRFVQGLYTEGAATMYVGAGLGTTAAPVRIGMPPELPVLRLVAEDGVGPS